MRQLTPLGWIAAAVCALASSAGAVSIGDQAPQISVTDWVKGKPMDILTDGRGKVIVVEFWATWCAPCVQIIPETTEFYQQHKDQGLVLVGLTDMGRGQSLKTVQEFVARQGPKMDYPVAFDSTQRTTLTYDAYALPFSVVIGKDGKIVWTGHPADPQMKKTVVDLLHDRYDAEAAARDAAKREQSAQMMNELYLNMQQGKVEEALALTERMLAADPENFDALQIRVGILVEELGAIERMRTWVTSFIEEHKDDAHALAMVAHLMMAIPDVSERQPDLAVKAAQMAYAADSNNHEICQAVALVHYEIGDLAAALRYQQRAIELADGPAAESARGMLAFFKTCQSLHEPAGAVPAGR